MSVKGSRGLFITVDIYHDLPIQITRGLFQCQYHGNMSGLRCADAIYYCSIPPISIRRLKFIIHIGPWSSHCRQLEYFGIPDPNANPSQPVILNAPQIIALIKLFPP